VVPALFGPDGGVVGGAERYVMELARYMSRVVPTRLVSFGPRAERRKIESLDVEVLKTTWRVCNQPSNPMAAGLARIVATAGTLHLHQKHVLATSLSGLLARLFRKKVFVTDYGGGGWDLSAYVSTDRLFAAELHLSAYSRSIEPARSIPNLVILGGVDTTKFCPAPTRILSGRRPIVFVGRLLPHKGVDVLIRAVGMEQPVEIIGQPYDNQYLEALKNLAKGKQIVFRHDCADGALVDAYRRALAVVLPSVYVDMYGKSTPVPELLGQTLLEGMACGIPGVSSSAASLPEVVQDGVTGFVVPPNDERALGEKLARLEREPAERDRMGRAARNDVTRRFTWESVVERCLDAYGAA
jgi:glycosyltransferase involved in cell wall biosynthesis